MDKRPELETMPAEETLDPRDWSAVQALSARIVEDAIGYLRDLRERPVWQEMPAEVKAAFGTPLPTEPMPLEAVYREVVERVMSYSKGNVHPRFWAWYMGAGNLAGALGDFLAAIDGSNVGGGNHAAAALDQQVVAWCKQMVGFPASASGTLESGGSMANLICLAAARTARAGIDVRELGIAATERPLRFYASDQVHGCHRKAVETLGHGNRSLRRIPTDDGFRIDIDALRAAINEDRAAGWTPICIIGTAGTVNTGAIDPLGALADLAAQEGLWFHVDGCIGALIAIAPENAGLVSGIARADSLALDPHKWLHAPFEAGCALIRDPAAHRNAFAVAPEYLKMSSRGVASAHWLHEYGLQTSRGFKALKVWMALKEHGVEKFGRLIDQNIAQGRYLAELIKAEPLLQLVTPPTINIVCFRFRPNGCDENALRSLNVEIMLRLQEEGIAVISDTTLHGRHCLRVAICNHRTRREDLRLLLRETLRIGAAVLADDGEMERAS